jgi:hypothetical protein
MMLGVQLPLQSKKNGPLQLLVSFKINFGTAIRDHLSAQVAVCHYSNGNIIKAISQINPPCDPNYGEA